MGYGIAALSRSVCGRPTCTKNAALAILLANSAIHGNM